MKRSISQLFLLLIVFVSLSSTTLYSQENFKIDQLENLSEREVKNQLRAFMSRNQRKISYKQAKDLMFQRIDNENGEVCCVYSEQHCIRTNKTPGHTLMNAEHTWPQSKGATGIAKSDLHHLFPTQSQLNSARSNYPFCNVEHVKWEKEGSKLGKNKKGTVCFEPPSEHKGNVARAMFYFAIRYSYNIDQDEEDVLRQWHRESPVDSIEVERHEDIVKHQNNQNLFVTHPELVDLVTNF